MLERRADFAEGRADALGLTGPKSLEEEIAELRATDAVDAELEATESRARGEELNGKEKGICRRYSLNRRDKKIAGVCSTLRRRCSTSTRPSCASASSRSRS